ncbi:unnamed protein product [Knipowitschia caucasica]|uniref:Uncharacterized protein n=1 Tax=Knipowitschia caucasica TaxID=637954 RepID=A0AAV2KX93_KNICA
MAQVQLADSRAEEGEWSTALLDCFEDPASCCYGFWCGPCLACTVAGRMKECYCLPLCDYCLILSWPGAIPPAALGLRIALRKNFNIQGSVVKDICISWCCSWCSWCQMHRELKRRSKVPTIVNVQNVVQMQPAPMMMPQSNMMMPQSNMMMPQSNMMMPQSNTMMPQDPMLMPQDPMMSSTDKSV